MRSQAEPGDEGRGTRDQGPREAFTLVELLVVIAIIGVLAALLLPAVMRAISRTYEAKNKDELSDLAIALQNFYYDNKFYPPSRLRLCDNKGRYASAPSSVANLDADSKFYLTQMFPKMDAVWSGAGVDWNGNGTLTNDVTLYGDQCLVFFLAGQQNCEYVTATEVPAVHGFSTLTANPATSVNPVPAGERTRIYYDFRPERLKRLRTDGNNYFSYVDIYKARPVLYFTSWKGKENKYNRYGTASPSDCPDSPGAGGVGAISGATPATANDVWPYQEADLRFMSPDQFQLISAGKDKLFGTGSIASVAAATRYYWKPKIYWSTVITETLVTNGRDDQSNFAKSVLAAGP